MESIIKSFPKAGLFLMLSLSLLSCGENHALSEDTYYYEEENARWIPDEDLDYSFLMIDMNGISNSYKMDADSYYFNKGWSSVLGITTHISYTEYHWQSYRSTFGTNFNISLTAGTEPHGDWLNVVLSNTEFRYDLENEVLTDVEVNYQRKSMTITEDGYEARDERINSFVEILDSLSTSYHEYASVLHFALADLGEYWGDFTVKDIYLAKDFGLIKYVLKNGIYYERK